MSEIAVRTRFAPSPTGFLHIGGARTALFSWLFAKALGGQFILRVEDTDLKRSSLKSVDAVLDDLRWLGIDWDEGPAEDNRTSQGDKGPYFQSERTSVYEGYLEQLKKQGLAYPSFESKEEVEEARQASIVSGVMPVSSGMEADAQEVALKAKEGIQPAWRFRMPQDGVTQWIDAVKGKTKFENRLMADIVIWRSDGTPTYNFAAAVDDCVMGITHVLRGDDHVSNTPRQLCLAKALGLAPPIYGHFPMILGSDKQRLSKRHGATAVGEFRDQGFLPETVVNFLALLGWSLDDKTTKISLDELKQSFSLDRVGRSAAVFDPIKLEWLNGQYVRERPLAEIVKLSWPLFVKAGLIKEEEKDAKAPWFAQLIKSLQTKVRKLSDLPEEARFFFEAISEPEEKALKNYFKDGDPARWLEEYAAKLTATDFSEEALELMSRNFSETKEMKFKQLVGPLRACLSGRGITPGIFETLVLLGKDVCLQRIAAAKAWKAP